MLDVQAAPVEPLSEALRVALVDDVARRHRKPLQRPRDRGHAPGEHLLHDAHGLEVGDNPVGERLVFPPVFARQQDDAPHSPCRSAFIRARVRPSTVRGPVLRRAFSRLAMSCFADGGRFGRVTREMRPRSAGRRVQQRSVLAG